MLNVFSQSFALGKSDVFCTKIVFFLSTTTRKFWKNTDPILYFLGFLAKF